MERIIQSIIWDDLYTLSMSQGAFIMAPNAKMRMSFTDREPDRGYSKDIIPKLREQVAMLADLSLQSHEYDYLKSIRFMKPHYLEWLRGYRMDPNEVNIEMRDGKLCMDIEGYCHRVAFWEMKLLLATSTLHFLGMEKRPGWEGLVKEKGAALASAKCSWIDFGTRRAFSPSVQDYVVATHKQFAPYFRGTSNVYLAMKHGIPPFGTVAHWWFMLYQVLTGGFRNTNYNAMEAWSDRRLYDGDLGMALPDTLTTEVFLRELTRKHAKLWDGFRLDSGQLLAKAMLIARFIERVYDVDPLSKIWTPSDSLNIEKTIAFRDGMATFLGSPKAKITAGIGTFMVNDCGYDPRSIVIKPTAFSVGQGWQPVIKLSDTQGKNMGEAAVRLRAQQELAIPKDGWDTSLSLDDQVNNILLYRQGDAK